MRPRYFRQRQQNAQLLLATINNVGSKTLFKPVLINIATGRSFFTVCEHVLFVECALND